MTLMTIGATAERLERQDLSPNPIMVAEKCGQVLINAVTVHMGTGTNLSGLATNQELAPHFAGAAPCR